MSGRTESTTATTEIQGVRPGAGCPYNHLIRDPRAWLVAMSGVCAAMGAEERSTLFEWEKSHLGGDYATSDWPGWQKYIGRPPWTEGYGGTRGVPKDRGGFVYLLAGGGLHKIGKTLSPEKRVRQIAAGLPFAIETLCILEAADRHQLERALHVKYAHKRVNGEWFDLDPEDVSFIRAVAEVKE